MSSPLDALLGLWVIVDGPDLAGLQMAIESGQPVSFHFSKVRTRVRGPIEMLVTAVRRFPLHHRKLRAVVVEAAHQLPVSVINQSQPLGAVAKALHSPTTRNVFCFQDIIYCPSLRKGCALLDHIGYPAEDKGKGN